MAEEDPADIRFLGEQIKRPRGDLRTLKADGAQTRADLSRLEGEVAGVKADVTRVEMRLDAFAERVDDRFDQMTELIKSSFRILGQKVDTLDGRVGGLERRADGLERRIDGFDTSLGERIDRIEAKIYAFKPQ